MDVNPLISVIMPVYKVEKYLSLAIESIRAQTYNNFELILVDDCSPDLCGKICDHYSEKDKRIKVVHKEKNEGLGKARSTGLSVCTGKYVMFVDSDDWIESKTLSAVVSQINNDVDIDIAVFGLTMHYEKVNGETEYKACRIPSEGQAVTKEQIGNLLTHLDNQGVFAYMCNKLYRTDFLKNSGVEFNTIQSMEDFFYNIEIFPKAMSVITISESFYNYRKPKHETLVSAYNPMFFELCKKRYFAEKGCLETLETYTTNNIQYLCAIYVKHLITCFARLNAENTPLRHKEKIKKAKEYLEDEVTKDVLDTFIPQSFKMKFPVIVFKKKSVFGALLIGKMVGFVQNHSRKLYSAVRGKR